ncbi:glycosyltransferase involved in cell wall biosynthesis [Actinomycetospora succinea]|uniref:Glycosyltransferase involved in cell wall biosynthesis n=1 Tax=Actinomycetospora succinea TaxID=663603 RepID=A0A4R6VD90_9PSEU|nr:glycosyltransferase [Actinomycetospora succinea]TDQ60712.1 glycosyltransferase involved in cell wall biosynthesis [Actinomycetospora succinea]
MPAGQALLFTSRRDDADAALLAAPGVAPFTWRRLLRALRDPDLEVLEVAEPLWLGEWRRALRYIALARAVRVVRRRRVAVATYAIENLDARERVPSRVARLALAVSLLSLDAVVFGTSGAAENYRRAFGWSLRRARHTVLPPRLDACSVCAADGTPREATVLFLGTPSERKGFPVLLEAWALAGAAERGWRLVVADPRGSSELALPAGVSVTVDPPRAQVHAMLRSATVVAMPSVRVPGWREQIGLPLVEGLAHGCRVVTTTETGLADDLRDHPAVELTTPRDPQSLADGLLRAMRGRVDVPPGRRGHTKSDVVAWWRSACMRRW